MKHELNTDGKKMEWWSIGVMGGRVEVGKGGQEMGKWRSFSHFETAFSHLFPRFSTQVVDFPRMTVVSIFWGGNKNSRISGKGMNGRGIRMKSKRCLAGLSDEQYDTAKMLR